METKEVSFISIPFWSDFNPSGGIHTGTISWSFQSHFGLILIFNEEFEEDTHVFVKFQSHFGLILIEAFEDGLTISESYFNPILVWF